jgi:hypothetical protein
MDGCPIRDHVGSNTGLTQHRQWVNFIHERRRCGFNRITLVPFVDMVFDKLTWNAAWSILSIGKYDLSLQISFTLLVSNIICTYETLGNKMAGLAAECAAQWIQHSCRLGVGAGAGMICH